MNNIKMKIIGGFILCLGVVGVVASQQGGGEARSSGLAAQSDRPNYLVLKSHVEKLTSIESMCSKQDPSTCFCELAEQIKDEHDAIARLLMDDPALRGYVIAVRQPASELPAARYDLNKLPQVPDETRCLSTVAAPTLIDDQTPEI